MTATWIVLLAVQSVLLLIFAALVFGLRNIWLERSKHYKIKRGELRMTVEYEDTFHRVSYPLMRDLTWLELSDLTERLQSVVADELLKKRGELHSETTSGHIPGTTRPPQKGET